MYFVVCYACVKGEKERNKKGKERGTEELAENGKEKFVG